MHCNHHTTSGVLRLTKGFPDKNYLAIKDWVRLKRKETGEQREAFEQRYGMDFPAFKQAWQEDRIANKHSYEVERDYWEWEAVVTDEERLRQMLESLP